MARGPAIIIYRPSRRTSSRHRVCVAYRCRGDARSQRVFQARSEAAMRIDPVEFEIFKNFFVSIAEEMGVTLCRTGFSPNIKERLDYSCAHLRRGRRDHRAGRSPARASGRDAALGEGRHRARRDGTGRYRSSLTTPSAAARICPTSRWSSPVFLSPASAKKPAFFVANRAHHSDVGGMSPGSMPLAREVFQEGLIIPPIKLVKRGRIDPGDPCR